jgi:hypothetical protein
MPERCRSHCQLPSALTMLIGHDSGNDSDAALVGQGGLEPPTPRLSSVCSNQLSYWPKILAIAGHRIDPEHRDRSTDTQAKTRIKPEKDARTAPASCFRRREPGHTDIRHSKAVSPSDDRPEVSGSCVMRKIDARQAGDAGLVRRPVLRPNRIRGGLPRRPSLKGGDPAAGSPTATLLRLHPSR